eukprot:CAMPEP_0114526190 /NCGR_PEP_ID=MMETSP0109-20121206/22872_1 /TAXON_ID=29199 /ORGANISM="Chlorarachnion reptans, Strain CCCM449" /LENGTH=232 /DNA_ID=CAMNT_0001707915 /DNA_START=59 /DNA_END=757 /DNA_ORIENTATION=+
MSANLDKSLDQIIEEKESRQGKLGSRRGEIRSHPYRRPTQNAEFGQQSKGMSLKVAAHSNVKGLAGKIAHTSRQTNAPVLLATGSDAINQAVKAITIARSYLEEDGIDLRVQCDFEEIKGFKAQMTLTKASSKPRGPKIDPEDLYVKNTSDPHKVAGAIAARIRDNKIVGIYAKGADAVSAMVKSVTVARLYLDEDNLDLLFAPTFVSMERKEGDDVVKSNYMKLSLLMQQL